MLPAKKTAAEKSKVAALKACLLAHVYLHPLLRLYYPRVKGLLDMLSNVSVKERLNPLVQSGAADVEHVKAWSRLRNKHVHPKDIDIKKMATGDFQEILSLMHTVTVLMYHITFFMIGYQGLYSDYVSYNWPVRIYPLPAPPS